MRTVLLIFIGMQCLASTSLAQVFPSLSQRQEFLSFINPAAITYGEMAIDPSKDWSVILSYRQHLNSLDETSPKIYLGGANRNFQVKNLHLPVKLWVSKFDAHPLSFHTLSAGGGALLNFSSSFQGGVGLSLGYNNYRIGHLRPWNLGDPVLMLENNKDGNFHFGVGLFFSSIIPMGNLDKLTIYGGVSAPFAFTCGEGKCYSYQADMGAFLINSRSKWSLLAKYAQLGCVLSIENKFSLNIHGYFQQTVSGFMQVGFLGRPEINIDDRNKLRLGFGLNSSGVVSSEVGLLLENISNFSVRIGATFDVYLSGQYFGPALEHNFGFAM